MVDSTKEADPFYYENVFRPIFEHKMACGWLAGSAMNLLLTSGYTLTGLSFGTSAAMGLFGLYRYFQGIPLARKQAKLDENDLQWKNAVEIFAQKDKNQIHLGEGFLWGQEHAQRSKQILSMSSKKAEVNIPWPYKPFVPSKDQSKVSKVLGGLPWIHGIGDSEPIIVDGDTFVGNTAVFGATRQGKTRLLEILSTYAVHQPRRAVIIIDPKGDEALIERHRLEHKRQGRENDFYVFHPAKPSTSCRIDPLANYSRTTEIASRITALLTSDSKDSDSFVAFAWKTVNAIAQAMDYCGKKPNIMGLKVYLDDVSGASELLKLTILTYLKEQWGEHWLSKTKPYFQGANDESLDRMDSVKPISLLETYRKATKQNAIDNFQVIDEIASTVLHEREHYSKMILNLSPVMSKLSSKPLDDLLSPDVATSSKERPIINMADIINEGKTLYICLDALTDPDMSSAVGSILTADLTACAGFKYNHEGTFTREIAETNKGYIKEDRKISLYIDEAAEVINKQVISMLNKSAGAGFETTILSQTFQDFVAKTGSEAMARQVLGNCNTLISFKVTEASTQEYVTESFGDTTIKQTMQTMSTNTSSGDELSTWGGGYGERLIEAEAKLFSPTLLGNLPRLQYIARFSDGRIVKGRIPILRD